ncbi:hypothetical protein AX15_006798 [Amanita polypyramis BW_CC]|nr:hypothetical protein AX15_006798 [Amanita polypyramis BW_CC]
MDLGFQIYFVFDGACPEIKFPTVASRLTQTQAHHSLLFFRTSANSRNTGRFLKETRIMPPLAYSTCIQTLQLMTQRSNGLQVHFADEEGDPFAVELAGRVGGYVIGSDSDFVVLNSEGYKGYIPLDEMVWLLPESMDPVPDGESDGEFRTVRKAKTKRKVKNDTGAGRGIIPTGSDVQRLTLSFSAYSPELLATHLKLPVTLLPLLGAVVGNDFSTRSENPRRNVQSLFFERQLTLSQRVDRAASTIHSILSLDSGRKRAKHQVGSVMDLIDRTVNALLSRWTTTMASGEIDKIAEGIVNATLQYAIPKYQGNLDGKGNLWPTEICALHDPGTCPLLPMVSHLLEDHDTDIEETDQAKIGLRGLYITAYRQGVLSHKMMDVLNTATYWPRLFLENPDIETTGRSIGRPIRQWIYAILADAVGLPTKDQHDMRGESTASGQVDTAETDRDDDELIDVVESNSEDEDADLLAPLRGELQKLHMPQQENSDQGTKEERAPSVASRSFRKHVSPAVLTITEHLRRGIRIAEEIVDVVPLTDLLSSIEFPINGTGPLLLRPRTDALTVLLRVGNSDTSVVRALKDKQLTVALGLRWVICTLQRRAEETGSRERDQERWTKREARCFLAAFMWSAEQPDINDSIDIKEYPLVVDRNVQLSAQILASLESIDELASVLLISDLVPSVSRFFSGKRFHALLTGTSSVDDSAVPTPLWKACQDGLEHAFLEANKKHGNRKKKAVVAAPPPLVAQKSQGSLFTLLTEGTA